MQREARPSANPAEPARAGDAVERQAEIVRALTAQSSQSPNDPELRTRLAEAYHRIDVLVRRRDGWSDDGRPAAGPSRT